MNMLTLNKTLPGTRCGLICLLFTILFLLFILPASSYADLQTSGVQFSGVTIGDPSSSGPPDPCAGTPAIGTVCTGGASYAGQYSQFDNKKYMTTPSDSGQYPNWAAVAEITGATSTSDGTGNTNNLAARGSGYAAAYYCKNLSYGGYSTGWFLPAIDELNSVLYANKNALGGFETYYHWSSTEYSQGGAWAQRFNDGATPQMVGKTGAVGSVRCVRTY